MNAMARTYKPAPTASGTVRPQSAGRSKAPAAGSPVRKEAPAPTPVSQDGFDYEAEVRRLCGQGPAATLRDSSSDYAGASESLYDSRVAPRGTGAGSPSRFRWVQPKDDETQPPKQRPERVITSASKARNQMYRPVDPPKAEINTESDEWRRLTPAERAARILGR